MTLKKASDPLPLEGFLLSEEDLRALRRGRQARTFSLTRIGELFPRVFPVTPRRTTSEGWEPFRLEEEEKP